MLIGQDPTIFKGQERVEEVLMLNDSNSQLSRWLHGMIGEENYDALTIYATNLVKCTFSTPPSTKDEGSFRFLKPYFSNCQEYLREELRTFKPYIVITLGESAHKLFRTLLDNKSQIAEPMKEAFNGEFFRANIGEVNFYYSPCLHIKTFRIAETYGKGVVDFKGSMQKYLMGI